MKSMNHRRSRQMDCSARGEQPHAVCVPSPAQGHVNAMLHLAKLLHCRGFHITFVHTDSTYNRILATSGPSSLAGHPSFCFDTIPDGRQSSDPVNGEELSSLCDTVRNSLAKPFRQLLKRLNESRGPKVSCIVSDTFSSYTLEVAADLGIPDLSFCSVSACSFWGFFKYEELMEKGIIPLKSDNDLNNGYLDTCTDWIPGKNMRLRDFPSFLRTTDPNDPLLSFCKDESQNARKATAIVINTFDELEASVLDALPSVLPPIYAIGPLNLMCRQISNESLKAIKFNLWEEDYSCLEWLDRKAHESVIYVNFGSITVMSSQQLIEFAWGLANSAHNFLWVMRPDTVTGDPAALPEEFFSEIGERGLLVSWCPQEKVLMHPSVGGFMTHSGWNSTLESISEGVPMICWPYNGDQPTNCRYVCNEWGLGLEINNNVKREEVEGLVKELLRGEKGTEMRKTALMWKQSAIKATRPDGKSYLNLERVIKEVLQKKELDYLTS